MESYLIYIGKSALAAGAFYLAYLAFFQNQKQFAYNRIYLPVSLALSFIIPLITFTTVNYVEPVPVESTPVPVFTESFEPVISVQHQPQFTWEWYHYLFTIYSAGVVLFLFRLLLGHVKALHIIRESKVRVLFRSIVNISQRDIHPFSFFNKIVISQNTLSHPHLEMIVAHEKIHVQEKHTLDILFTEILFLLQWFNPFAWLMKDAVKNNIEYKTDHEIAKTTDAQTYQMAMVALADKQGVAPFLTALNGSQLKNRIIMMKKKRTKSRFVLLKQLIVLPLLAVLVMGLSNREMKTEIIPQNENPTAHSEIQKKSTVHDQMLDAPDEQPEEMIPSKKNKQTDPLSDLKNNNKTRAGNENDAVIFSENPDTTQKPDTNDSKKTDKIFNPDNRLYIVDGKEYKGDINDIDVQEIERIEVLKEASATLFYGEKGKNGVVLITTKSANKPWLSREAGQIQIKGKVISAQNRKPIPGATIFFTVHNTMAGTVSNISGDFTIQANDSNVFFEFLNAGYHKKEFAWDGGSKELLVELVPDENSGIPARGVSSFAGREDTVPNKNSNLPDTPAKNTKWEKMLEKAGIESYPEGKEPIVIQDGYETLHNANDIASLYNPSIVKSIRYNKNVNIDVKRKELAKNGFIEIKTTLPKEDKRLYVIDGEEVFLKNQKPSVYIYPRQLQKMKGLSKEEGIKKYGNKAKHGAVEITTTKPGGNEKDQELNTFQVSIELLQNQFIVQGLEGCAFKELTFMITDHKPVAINQSGMASSGTVNSADDSDFLFEIEKINDQMNLTGKTGTAWKKLSYKPANKKHVITETGVSKAYHPLIIIDGMITGYKSTDHINPGDIQSVTLLKEENAIKLYGDKGKNGVIEITMKPLRIYSELQLRRFIANEIRYPVLAQKSNLEKTVNLSVKIDKDGKTAAISDQPQVNDFTLDQVVVVGYNNQDNVVTGYPSKEAAEEARKKREQLFENEIKRVVNKISKIDIEKFKGKTVGITVKFLLQ